jgi:hypothetical protein
MARLGIILLVVLDVFMALGALPLLLIVGAYINLEGPLALIAMVALFVCWFVAPIAALIVAWRQGRRGAGRGRIALILLAALVLALVGQGILEQLPVRGV